MAKAAIKLPTLMLIYVFDILPNLETRELWGQKSRNFQAENWLNLARL